MQKEPKLQPSLTQATLPPQTRQKLDSLKDMLNLKKDPSYALLVSLIVKWFINLSDSEIVEIIENYISQSLEYTKEALEERGIKVQKIPADNWGKLKELSQKLIKTREDFEANWENAMFNKDYKLIPVMVTIAILKAVENAQENREFLENKLFPNYKINPS
jgi:hypothetical protein